MKDIFNDEVHALFKAVLSLKTEAECAAFFEDLCTVKEMQDLSQRLHVAQMLNRGEKYQSIEQSTGASTATISRVNKCLVYGKGGYRMVLGRQKEE